MSSNAFVLLNNESCNNHVNLGNAMLQNALQGQILLYCSQPGGRDPQGQSESLRQAEGVANTNLIILGVRLKKAEDHCIIGLR